MNTSTDVPLGRRTTHATPSPAQQRGRRHIHRATVGAAMKANGNRRLGRLARKKIVDHLKAEGLHETAAAVLTAPPSMLPELMAGLGIDAKILGDTPMPSTHANPPLAKLLIAQAIAERDKLAGPKTTPAQAAIESAPATSANNTKPRRPRPPHAEDTTSPATELRRILSTHVAAGNTCAACGFAYLERHGYPLCPTAANALRQLVASQRSARSLARFTDSELRTIAAQHHPTPAGHRCARCGLSYAGGRAECPTRRAIQIELEVRTRDLTVRSAGQAVCKARSKLWEVDGGSYEQWVRAIEGCNACPLLQACKRDVEQQVADGDAPNAMIVGGILFTSDSQQISDLEELAEFAERRYAYTQRINHRRRAKNPPRREVA